MPKKGARSSSRRKATRAVATLGLATPANAPQPPTTPGHAPPAVAAQPIAPPPVVADPTGIFVKLPIPKELMPSIAAWFGIGEALGSLLTNAGATAVDFQALCARVVDQGKRDEKVFAKLRRRRRRG